MTPREELEDRVMGGGGAPPRPQSMEVMDYAMRDHDDPAEALARTGEATYLLADAILAKAVRNLHDSIRALRAVAGSPWIRNGAARAITTAADRLDQEGERHVQPLRAILESAYQGTEPGDRPDFVP